VTEKIDNAVHSQAEVVYVRSKLSPLPQHRPKAVTAPSLSHSGHLNPSTHRLVEIRTRGIHGQTCPYAQRNTEHKIQTPLLLHEYSVRTLALRHVIIM